MIRTTRRASGGFSLIELITVIAIIAILSGIIMANLQDSRKKARDTKRLAELAQIQLALEQYWQVNGSFPDYPDGVEIGVRNSIDEKLAPFLAEVPRDPLAADKGGGGAYRYWYDSSFRCNAREGHVGLFAIKVEDESNSNFVAVCGGGGQSSNFGAGDNEVYAIVVR